MIRWSDVMEEHKEQLIEALEQAFKDTERNEEYIDMSI